MVKRGAKTLKFTAVAFLVLLVGAGAVFALGRAASEVTPDTVVALKSLGMTCGSCAGKIEAALKENGGVADVGVDVNSGQVLIAYDSKVIQPEALAETVTAAGYKSGILGTMSMEKYQAVTGQSVSASAQASSGGCSGGCCKRN